MHNRLLEMTTMLPEPTPAPQQPQLPPGSYMLVPTTGFPPEQVAAMQQLYQLALQQAQPQPRNNFRWEQAHHPRWN